MYFDNKVYKISIMNLFIKQNDKKYEMAKGRELDSEFTIIAEWNGVMNRILVRGSDDFIYYKKHMGAFNLPIHLVFECFGNKKENYFYHKETNCLFKNKEQITKFVENIVKKYLDKRRK